jgi:aminoglycoside phosphotransferase (APT) family kinase protein
MADGGADPAEQTGKSTSGARDAQSVPGPPAGGTAAPQDGSPPGARAEEPVAALPARARLPAGRVTGWTALSGGTYNTLYAVDLAGGERVVLKVPPPADRPRLSYEAELLHGEALFARYAAEVDVPAPRLLRAEPAEGPGAEPYLVMTYCPGEPWSAPPGGPADGERNRLRRDLGALVARLHSVSGPGFGYPAQRLAPLSDRWEAAFGAMASALLDDAERFGAWLPVPVPELRALFAGAEPDLARVTRPALVHFDLWPGNVLLDGPPGARTISGLIDGERMFWGDPLADFASLGLMDAPPEEDEAFLAGYLAGGGRLERDGAAARRTALYRVYLYLIMLVETVPRGSTGERLARVRDFTEPRLLAQVAAASG